MTSGPVLYPKADHSTQWGGQGNSTMPMDHVKWLQHTTETAGGWPSYTYNGVPMGSAPTLTYEPWQHKWRQHFPINGSSRALQNDGSFMTNRADVVQTEISCYCNEAVARSVGRMDRFVEAIDQQAIDDLGDFAVWMHTEWGMGLGFYPEHIPWPAYTGQQTVRRMTIGEFQGFSGIVGHMVAPGNTHLDPSSIDNVAVKGRIDQLLGGVKGPEFPDVTLGESLLGAFHARGWGMHETFVALAKKHPKVALFGDAAATLEAVLPPITGSRQEFTHWLNNNQKG